MGHSPFRAFQTYKARLLIERRIFRANNAIATHDVIRVGMQPCK